MIIMNLSVPMKFRLRSDGYFNLPIMFLSLRKLWPQVVQWQHLALVRQVEVETLIVVESLEIVEPLEVVEI